MWGLGLFGRGVWRIWEILGVFVWGNVGKNVGEERGIVGLVLGVLCGFVSARGVF